MEKRPNVKLTLEQGYAVQQDLQADCSSVELAKILHVKKAYLLRRSVDARHKNDVHFIATVGIGDGACAPQAIQPLRERETPEPHLGKPRPVVVGMGPAGLFAALELAEAGLCPIVIERGAPVEERTADIDLYHRTRVLNTRSNVQFGEGGAGTFSDGKLTTGKNSPLIAGVLQTFVAAGAPQEILWQAKPHIGTDVLGGVVADIRRRIIACGGDVRFHTQLTDLVIERGSLTGVVVEGPDGASEQLPVGRLVLAVGHSARDTFEVLKRCGLELEQKPFSIGVRIEHSQQRINEAQYGRAASHPALGAADYKLTPPKISSGRAVYSFCMCPGGEVVAASSEEGELCVNGMSRQARAGRNANAALLCNVVPEDFPDPSDPLSGIAFQRSWERAAFELGGSSWRAPLQTLGSFLDRSCRKGTDLEPTYPLGVEEAPISSCLPDFASQALREAIPFFDRRIKGYGDARALLTGVEARSSSPVRVVREKASLQATRVMGLYPCGEGAGYAGGIMSAAVDGIRVARQIIGDAASQ